MVTPHKAHAEMPSEDVAPLQRDGTFGSSQGKSVAEHPDVEQAAELLHEATRVVSSLGTCVDASVVYLAEVLNAPKQQSVRSTSHTSQQDSDTPALQELQHLAEEDLHDMEKRVIETEAIVRNLKNKIVLNSQLIDRLVAYRLHS